MGVRTQGLGIGSAEHDAQAKAFAERYRQRAQGQQVRLAKSTSNLFRFRSGAGGLDAGGLDDVIEVDSHRHVASVQGMTTYERIVDATLAHNLMPLVVPQLKTITLGGAVAGLGIESTSFRHGLPHESVLAMDILTPDGNIVRATPDNEHADLFRGFPNSYGTLGYTLRLDIELEPVKPYVRLRHVRFSTIEESAKTIAEICATGHYRGDPVEFLDGTIFSSSELYLTIGQFCDSAPGLSDYTGKRIYYRSIPNRDLDYLRTRDYLWRWDTDWFWCSRALGVQHPFVRGLVPRKYLRSDVYRKVVALDQRFGLTDTVRRLQGRQPDEAVIQDVEVPLERLSEFIDFFHEKVGIRPIWLCPIQLRDQRGWTLYPMNPEITYVNVGFWAKVALGKDDPADKHNREIERKVSELGGHKSLYSTSYYSHEEFVRLYNGEKYQELKSTYDQDSRLRDLYSKCVQDSSGNR